MKSALSFTAVIAVIAVVATASLGCVSSAEASPVAPVLPESYHASFTAFWPDGSHPSYSELFYDWGTMSQVTQHTNCISGFPEQTAHPCSLIMRGNNTYVVSAYVDNGCCRFPDCVGLTPPPPNAYSQWTYMGNITFNDVPAMLFEWDNFRWILAQDDPMRPLQFMYGGSRAYYDFTSAIVPGAVDPARFALPQSEEICNQFCPFKFD